MIITNCDNKSQENYGEQLFVNINIAVIGNVDSGKSTLVGVLTKGIIDDGRGYARSKVLNYTHEQNNGKTSSIAQEIMGFNKNLEQVIPERIHNSKDRQWNEITSQSQKIIKFFDLCGHEKYLKTTIFGMTGLCPDFAMIVIGANMGITRMTKEHMVIALALKIPFFIVISKIDLCPENIYNENMQNLVKLLKSGSVNRMPILIKETYEIDKCAKSLNGNAICPIFAVSNVNQQGLGNLIKFMSLLMKSQDNDIVKKPVRFNIEGSFMISGFGLVLSGLLKQGCIQLNQNLLIEGPDFNGKFKNIIVKSIEYNRQTVSVLSSGQCACIGIKSSKQDKIDRNYLIKGMVCLDYIQNPFVTKKFEAEIIVLHHSSTIKLGYQAIMHCGVVLIIQKTTCVIILGQINSGFGLYC